MFVKKSNEWFDNNANVFVANLITTDQKLILQKISVSNLRKIADVECEINNFHCP